MSGPVNEAALRDFKRRKDAPESDESGTGFFLVPPRSTAGTAAWARVPALDSLTPPAYSRFHRVRSSRRGPTIRRVFPRDILLVQKDWAWVQKELAVSHWTEHYQR